MQDAVYHFLADHRPHSHLQIRRVLVESAVKNSILSSYDRGNVIIVVCLSEDVYWFYSDESVVSQDTYTVIVVLTSRH